MGNYLETLTLRSRKPAQIITGPSYSVQKKINFIKLSYHQIWSASKNRNEKTTSEDIFIRSVEKIQTSTANYGSAFGVLIFPCFVVNSLAGLIAGQNNCVKIDGGNCTHVGWLWCVRRWRHPLVRLGAMCVKSGTNLPFCPVTFLLYLAFPSPFCPRSWNSLKGKGKYVYWNLYVKQVFFFWKLYVKQVMMQNVALAFVNPKSMLDYILSIEWLSTWHLNV